MRAQEVISRYFAGMLAAVALTAAGCPVNQQKEVDTYRSVLQAGPAQRAARLKSGESLTLRQAIEQANRHNETLGLKGEEYLQALIQKDRAVAAFLPKVHFAPSYIRQGKTEIPGAADFSPTTITDVPVEGGLNVNLPKDVATLKFATASAERQRELLLDFQSAVFLDVAKTYYQVLKSEAQVEELKTSVEMQKVRLDDTNTRLKAGAARTLDVAQAEAQLAGTRTLLIQAQKDVNNGRSLLALLTGLAEVDGPLVDDLAVPGEIPERGQLLESARKHREDLAAAHKQVEAGVRMVQAAWSEYFPSVSLNFTYFLSRESFPEDVNWMGMLGVDVPIFTAGLIHADMREAWSHLRQAKLAESYLTRQVEEQLRVALENLEVSQKTIDELTVRKTASEESLRDSEQAYKVGLATNLDRLVAQDQLLSSQLALVSEQMNRKIFYLDLVRVAGALNVDTTRTGLEKALGKGKPSTPRT